MDYKQKIKEAETEKATLEAENSALEAEINALAAKRQLNAGGINAYFSLIQLYKSRLNEGGIFDKAIEKLELPVSEKLSADNTLLLNAELSITKHIDYFTHSSVLGEMILELYPEKYKTDEEKDKFYRQLSGVLSLLKRRRRINSYSPSGSKKNTLWGRNEWFDEKGKPIKEYLKEKAQQQG